MNEGVLTGYIRSAESGRGIRDAEVYLDRIDVSQELTNGNRFPMYDTDEQLIQIPRSPGGMTGADGRFIIWFRWDETAIGALVSGMGNRQYLTYHGRVFKQIGDTNSRYDFVMHNMRMTLSGTRLLANAGGSSPVNMGPPFFGRSMPPGDQVMNRVLTILSKRVPGFDAGQARSPENYMIAAHAELYCPF